MPSQYDQQLTDAIASLIGNQGQSNQGGGMGQNLLALGYGLTKSTRRLPEDQGGGVQIPLIPTLVNAIVGGTEMRKQRQELANQQLDNKLKALNFITNLAQLKGSMMTQQREEENQAFQESKARTANPVRIDQLQPGQDVNFNPYSGEQQSSPTRATRSGVAFIEGGPPTAGAFTADQLFGRFENLSKPFATVRDFYDRLESSAKDPSAAGDLSVIFSYMKILDPSSTVREGEQATAAQATGVPSGILNLYNKVTTGEKLNPSQRQDFVYKSRVLFKSAQENFLRDSEEVRKIARLSRINPDLVTRPITSQAQQDAIAEARRRGLI